MVLFEKKINKTYLWNTKIDMYQRGVTFEGQDFYAEYCKNIHSYYNNFNVAKI